MSYAQHELYEKGECLCKNRWNSLSYTVRIQTKGRAIKGFVVVNSWDLEPLNLLNCQPFLGYDKYLVALRKFYLFVGNEQRQFISKDIPCGQT